MLLSSVILLIAISAQCVLSLPCSTTLQTRAGDQFATLPPSQDPFYKLPDDIARYQRGQIIRSRKLPDTSSVFGPNAGDTYQLLYRTNSVRMNADATVTTVISPKTPTKGPPKIVAIASPEDSPATDCALSWALYPGSASRETVGGTDLSATIAQGALFNGYYVTLPDQEGSKAGWLAYAEGFAVLDSIRAIINHKETIPDSRGYKAVLTGYSGGGHGSAWAAQLASTYGKGIPIIALAAGGIPVDPDLGPKHLDGTMAAGLVFAGQAGYGNVYPEYEKYLQSILKPNGTEAFKALRDGSQCLNQYEVNLAFKSFNGSVTDPNYLSNPLSRTLVDENYLGRHQKAITDFPVLQLHSQVDNVVSYGPAFAYYQSQCSKGARIVLANPPTGDHVVTGAEAIPSFLSFIKKAFEGTLNVPRCQELKRLLIQYDGPEAVATMSQPVVDKIQASKSSSS